MWQFLDLSQKNCSSPKDRRIWGGYLSSQREKWKLGRYEGGSKSSWNLVMSRQPFPVKADRVKHSTAGLCALIGVSCNRRRHVIMPKFAVVEPASWQCSQSPSSRWNACIAKTQIPTITQPSYPQHLIPCDFLLFPRLKMALKFRCFASFEEIQQKATAGLRTIPEDELQRFFQQW
jgi:hypothetical protein